MYENVRAWVAAQVLFPLHECLKGHHSIRLYKHLKRTQWLDQKAILEIQKKNLHIFLNKIIQNVPFYHSYKSNLPQTPEQAISVLKTLPIMTKQAVTEHFNELRGQGASSCVQRSTGGSSGEPFQFLLSKRRISHDVAAKRRATQWWGMDIGDKELVVWGAPFEQQSQSFIKDVRDILLCSQFISSVGLNNQKGIEILKCIQEYKPKMLFAYPSILYHLALLAKERYPLQTWSHTKVAFVTSEMLEPFQKKTIESAFDCKVANGYGGRDLGFVAHSCFENNLHISSEHIFIEILDAQGKPCPVGSVGEIVVTHLKTDEFPFVRYRSGDFGALSPIQCACGRGLPVLEKLDGRVSDLVYSENGSVIHRNQIIQLVSQFGAIRQFRFEQFKFNEATLWLTLNDTSAPCKSQITRGFNELFGCEMNLKIIEVAELPPHSSGKHKFIISHLGQKVATQSEQYQYVS